MSGTGDLGVAMVGYAFMGAAHSQAWGTAPHMFDLPRRPNMRVLVGRNGAAATAAASRLGWHEVATDWRDVLHRDDIEVVDICTPGSSHPEIAIAALDAGKHVICEKPLANTLAEAEAMAEAAERARTRGIFTLVGFNYRRLPAIALAREWIADGRLGKIRQVRAAYRQDWASDPASPLVWRFQREHAGSGALGDIGSHIVDLAQFLLTDRLVAVTAVEQTFVSERPRADGSGDGPVDVDDCAIFSGHFRGGTLASFEATRFATGRKNALQIEVSGAHGSVAFDLERLNELQYYDARDGDASTAGFRRVLVTEADHPYMSNWWPPGHTIGWEHTFTHQVVDFVRAVASGDDPHPSFAEGLQVQQVLAAVSESATHDSRWTPIPPHVSARRAA
jgi:predicted dehydrogenase